MQHSCAPHVIAFALLCPTSIPGVAAFCGYAQLTHMIHWGIFSQHKVLQLRHIFMQQLSVNHMTLALQEKVGIEGSLAHRQNPKLAG